MQATKWSNILVPIDESVASKRALRQAILIAKQCNALVSLLHVVPAMLEGLPMGMSDFSLAPAAVGSVQVTVSTRLKEYGHQLLDDAAKKVEAAGVPFTKLPLGIGAAEEEILAIAKANKCDIIIMGTHGRHGVERMTLGSVAEYVIRHATVPVMCLRGVDDGAMAVEKALKKVLFLYDNSDISKQALVRLAVPVCKLTGAELHIRFHIERSIPMPAHDALLEKEKADAEAFLLQAEKEAAKSLGENKVFTNVVVAASHVADAICESASLYDLVIMSTHGRRGLTRFIMGSVAESVLRCCNTPVLVFHPKSTS